MSAEIYSEAPILFLWGPQMICSMLQYVNEIREVVTIRYLLHFNNVQVIRILISHNEDGCFSCLRPWSLRVWIRLDVRKKATMRKALRKRTRKKKKSNVNFSRFAQVWLFLQHLLNILGWPLPLPWVSECVERAPTDETHYQKLSILTVKATEPICTLLRSLLHFDNCFSPWTVEF